MDTIVDQLCDQLQLDDSARDYLARCLASASRPAVLALQAALDAATPITEETKNGD